MGCGELTLFRNCEGAFDIQYFLSNRAVSIVKRNLSCVCWLIVLINIC
jgi:hypothetical protein